MRKTHTLIKVMDALMQSPTDRQWGYELSKRSGVRSGAMYPVLARLLADGLLTDGWEDQAVTGGKRPPRRYYEVTGEGIELMEEFLREAATDARFTTPVGRATS
jgi:PadR family transcriptional regulator PadR